MNQKRKRQEQRSDDSNSDSEKEIISFISQPRKKNKNDKAFKQSYDNSNKLLVSQYFNKFDLNIQPKYTTV